ncbi:hypothetical protein BpHYR1_050739 [Brachionus plicatilis]|uniref:Uncharacterized protein n=1 Tax=Brachionus plicatilis TaxID=10195 RepID=A0A3M7RIK4_BRAPC|nr:hypothetical protein BpHYR1_050739 [Brachionus plicatilis]
MQIFLRQISFENLSNLICKRKKKLYLIFFVVIVFNWYDIIIRMIICYIQSKKKRAVKDTVNIVAGETIKYLFCNLVHNWLNYIILRYFTLFLCNILYCIFFTRKTYTISNNMHFFPFHMIMNIKYGVEVWRKIEYLKKLN